jgi:hypothetical protein
MAPQSADNVHRFASFWSQTSAWQNIFVQNRREHAIMLFVERLACYLAKSGSVLFCGAQTAESHRRKGGLQLMLLLFCAKTEQ